MQLDAYLAGLRAELERVAKDRRDDVEAEIARVERELNPKAERAQRKPTVERAVANPGAKRA